MCRNIKPLYNFEPPVTEDEIRAAALQFVRKVSGFNTPSKANEAAFLIKILTFNLVRRWARARHPIVATWRMPWIRRVAVHVPGRLLRAGGRRELRLAPRPMLC